MVISLREEGHYHWRLPPPTAIAIGNGRYSIYRFSLWADISRQSATWLYFIVASPAAIGRRRAALLSFLYQESLKPAERDFLDDNVIALTVSIYGHDARLTFYYHAFIPHYGASDRRRSRALTPPFHHYLILL